MYIAISNDDNKYYRTWATGEINIGGCICMSIDKIPNEIDDTKKQFYKLTENKIIDYNEVSVLDENGEFQYEQIKDENGNIIGQGNMITQTVESTHTEYSWEFDEISYNEYIKNHNNILANPTIEERLVAVEEATIGLMDLLSKQ